MNGEYSGNLGIISMPGTKKFCSKIDFYLKQWRETDHTFIIDAEYPRFSSGDGKVVLTESVRGKDIYIVSDPYNYSITYKMRGIDTNMSPDDHYQDIKRVISAINGKAWRISVIMTMLYGSRQHARSCRESLDCAVALRELENLGVKNIITFDAHDPRVQNAIPLTSFDNLYPNYQMMKALVRNVGDISIDPSRMIVVAPDAGGIQRCLKLAESLNLNIGMFYKRRDTTHVTEGHNPILFHKFLGDNLFGKDVIIVDDIMDTGESLIDSFTELKRGGAKRVFAFITFGMFTNGYECFEVAYRNHLFDKIFVSNLIYRQEEHIAREWLVDVDLSKYAAYIIESINKEISISKILDPKTKISKLIESLK
jgi:ribose-phosphate pyrophosphokinase